MITYKLQKPLLGWAKGEHLTYDPSWNEWTRKKTGESFTLRGSLGVGEVVLLLNAATNLESILLPINNKQEDK